MRLQTISAADDAAGLAIREMMRADVTALNQGVRNANDAISLIQTADGALGVIDEKLTRMKELAEQAATGTYTSTQRLIIDSEYQAMASEITRIANATDFNGMKLLDGSLSGATHDGSKADAEGMMKVHFGTGNDSAEDYYYIRIQDVTAAALGVGSNSTYNTSMDRAMTEFANAIKNEFGSMATGTAEERAAYQSLIDMADGIISKGTTAANKIFDDSKTLEEQYDAYSSLFKRPTAGADTGVNQDAGEGMRIYGSVEELQQAAFEYYRAETANGLGKAGGFGADPDAHAKALNNVAKMFDNAVVVAEGGNMLPQLSFDDFSKLSSTDREALKTDFAMAMMNTTVNGTTAKQSSTDIRATGNNYANYDSMAGAQLGTASTTKAYSEKEIKSFIQNLDYGYEAGKTRTEAINNITDQAIGKYGSGTQSITEYESGTILKNTGILKDETMLMVSSVTAPKTSGSITEGSKLADGTVLASGSVLGSGTTIGKGTTLGSLMSTDDMTLGKGTLLGSGTKLGAANNGVDLAEGTTLANGTTLVGDAAGTGKLGANTVLGAGTKLGAGTTLDAGTSLGGGTILAASTKLNAGTTLGDGTTLGVGTKLDVASMGDGSTFKGSAANSTSFAAGFTFAEGTTFTDGAFLLENNATATVKGSDGNDYTITGDGTKTIERLIREADDLRNGINIADPTYSPTSTITVGLATLTSSSTLGAAYSVAANQTVTVSQGSTGKVTVGDDGATLQGSTTLQGAAADNELNGNSVMGNGTLLQGTTTVVAGSVFIGTTLAGATLDAGNASTFTSGTTLRGTSEHLVGTFGSGSTLGGDLTLVQANAAQLGSGTTFGAGTKVGATDITLNGPTTMRGTTTLVGANTVLAAGSKLAEGTELAAGSAVPQGGTAINGAIFSGTDTVDEVNGVYGSIGFNADTNTIERTKDAKFGSFQAAAEELLTRVGTKVANTVSMNGNNVKTQENAQKALKAIDNAILIKDNIRADLGALQNRLENTITNLTTQAENLQAAESRISDVDVATEMTEFTRNQVLTQSAVSMLAQANTMPQMALKLIG